MGHEVVGVTVAVGMLAGYEEKARQRMYDACLVHEATYEGGVARRRPRSRGGRRSLGTPSRDSRVPRRLHQRISRERHPRTAGGLVLGNGWGGRPRSNRLNH